MKEAPEIISQRLAGLIKSVLNGSIPDENAFIQTDEIFWNRLMQLSIEQGVIAIALDGAMRLPKELQPAQTVKLQWIAHVESIKKRYKHQMEIVQELSTYFRENNIRMLLFKGLALSRFYPVPEHREFGDIDIYLYGKSREGDALLKQFAKLGHSPSQKHTSFVYKGIMIENHHFLLNKYMSQKTAVEDHLTNILASAGMNELFPPPDFDALFVMMHALNHFPSRIVLRHLCDLTVLFTAHKGKIDWAGYRHFLSETGLLKVANAFTALAIRFLGLDPEHAPPYESDRPLEDKIWEAILYPSLPPLPKEKRSLFNVCIYKIKLMRTSYWKYDLIFPGKFGKRILHSIAYHLMHPETIGKM